MYECEYCGAKYTDKDIESEEIIECEALVKEDVYCGCREFKKIENDNLDITEELISIITKFKKFVDCPHNYHDGDIIVSRAVKI
mgnify:FL=1